MSTAIVANTDPFGALANEVEANGHVLVCRLERLRNAAGYGKLGKYVVEEIEQRLRRNRLGWHTRRPIDNAANLVLLYTLGTQVEQVVRVVLDPTPEGADALRAVVNETASETLSRIRALVCA